MDRLETHLVRALGEQMATQKPANLPEGCEIIWSAFVALSRSRSRGMDAPNPISFQEIEAYCRLMRVPLEPRHVRAIMAMDAVWLSGTKEKPPLPDITAAAFDARIGSAVVEESTLLTPPNDKEQSEVQPESSTRK